MLAALALFLLNLVLCVALAWGIVLLVPIAVLDRNVNASIASFSLATLALTALLFFIFRNRTSPAELAATSLIAWGALAVVSAFLVPAASYLLIVPAMCGAVAVLMLTSVRNGPARAATAVVSSLPLVLLLTPVVYLSFLGLRMRLAPAVVALIVLGLWGLLPSLNTAVSMRAEPGRNPALEGAG
jgi:hypothetical protein